MRLRALGIEWFRGAADKIELEANGKSLVVYGPNGAGKSSFVDAVEYATRGGKILHAAHEYSGTKSVLSVRNTHTPAGVSSKLHFVLGDASDYDVEIKPDGSWSASGGGATHISTWDYKRIVLRQDEVSQFIHGTKGEKYSALLPLIGLGDLEAAATNLKNLGRAVHTEAGTVDLKAKLDALKVKKATVFGAATGDELLARLATLYAAFCPEGEAQADVERCTELLMAIGKKIEALTAEQLVHAHLLEIAGLGIASLVDGVRSAATKLVDSGESLIAERLEVISAAARFGKEAALKAELLNCPACGKEVSGEAFNAHIAQEQVRLKALQKDYDALKTQRGLLCDALATVKRIIGLKELVPWRAVQIEAGLKPSFEYVDGLVIQTLRETVSEEDLKSIEELVPGIVEAAKKSSETAPTSVKELVDAKSEAELIAELLNSGSWRRVWKAAMDLAAFLSNVEQQVRQEIRDRTEAVIKKITSDVKDLWKLIHPDVAIEDVHLYMPQDSDKAIDIGLKFYGVSQASPRISLSEGYRNGLGLCIFLAMAMADNTKDEPLILDDVVVSFDREHRGMIADVLDAKFKDRQVIIFTHDRDWYADLRRQLDKSQWGFDMLRPFVNPTSGIRWSSNKSSFAEARAHLPGRPDSAANDARKIMDAECAAIAEKLELRLPYRRGERNDTREAHQFLERISADGKRALKRKTNGTLAIDTAGIALIDDADALLVTWGNRGSHTTNVTQSEAEKLLSTCEAALNVFVCTSCGKKIWHAQAGSDKQCQCGELQWKG